MGTPKGYKVHKLYKLNGSEIESVKIEFDERNKHLYNFAVSHPEYFAQEPISVKDDNHPHGLIAATSFSEKAETLIRSRQSISFQENPFKILKENKDLIILFLSGIVCAVLSLYFIF